LQREFAEFVRREGNPSVFTPGTACPTSRCFSSRRGGARTWIAAGPPRRADC